MERFYAKESVQKTYKVIGILAMILLVVIIIFNPFARLGLNLFSQLLFFALAITFSVSHFLRPKRCYLEINDEELLFKDGLLGKTKLPLKEIVSIDYHPDLKFRIRIKRLKRRQVQIPNIFTIEDQEKILRSIKKHRKVVKINYLERPKNLIRKKDDSQKDNAVKES